MPLNIFNCHLGCLPQGDLIINEDLMVFEVTKEKVEVRLGLRVRAAKHN